MYAARRIVRRERIVFYQAALAGVIAVTIATALIGGHVARCLDIVVAGYGVFLAFGRIGCFSVACCYGRPARFGIAYGERHVKLGFWSRWSGRRLWPVQLLESAASLAIVFVALLIGWDRPGEPALIYAVGYGVLRFAFELIRGDTARPQFLGLSEAQWTSLVVLLCCAGLCSRLPVVIAAAVLVLVASVLIPLRRRREFWAPKHLHSIDKRCAQLSLGIARAETELGVAISRHELPDGRTDWIFSSMHPRWSIRAARRIAFDLWRQSEVVEGRLPGVIHIITPDILKR